MSLADLHRRGAKAVAREHSGDLRTFIEREDDEIAPPDLAHAGHGGADAQARDGPQDRCVEGREVHGHGC